MRIVVALLICCVCFGCSWRNGENGAMEMFPVEVAVTTYVIETSDGVALALHRHTARKAPQGAPILLCHSMGYNSNVWNINNSSSVATLLAVEGYDVWRLDFRGCGLSGPAAADTHIEDYALKDLPAAIEYVANTTEDPHILLVGQGVGGSAAMIYLLSMQKPMLAGLVLIGAPLTSPLPCDTIFDDRELARQCLVSPLTRFPSITRNPTPAPPKGWENLFYNPSNMNPNTVEALFRFCAEPIPDGVAKQFMDMIETGKLKSPDGGRIYIDEASMVRIPIYTVCGKGDNFAQPSALRTLFHKVASNDKTFRLFCRASGDGADFGNMDLICGKEAGVVVLPEIVWWLADHAAAPPQADGG